MSSRQNSEMDKLKQKEGDATATATSKMTATQRIEKLREVVVKRNKSQSPALYKAYKNLMQDFQKAGLGSRGQNLSSDTPQTAQADSDEENQDELIEFQRQQKRKRVKLMLIQSNLARKLTSEMQQLNGIIRENSKSKEGPGQDIVPNRQLEVSTPELRDDYVTRKASLDKLVDEFLEGSSLHLNQTGSLISLELFETPTSFSQHNQKALPIHQSSSDARITNKEPAVSILIADKDQEGKDSRSSSVNRKNSTQYYPREDSSLGPEMAITEVYRSDYYLAGRKRQSIFEFIPPSLRFYKIARCVAILCVFFQFRSHASAPPPGTARAYSFLPSGDARKAKKKHAAMGGRDSTASSKGDAATSTGANNALAFNVDQFKAGGELKLVREARKVLQKPPMERTREDKMYALNAIKSHVRGFNEYPIRVQHMIVTYGIYSELSASRVLIKQGHAAEWYYFILSGKVSVQTHPDNDMSTITVVGLLQRGDTSGEIEVLTGAKRKATMVCKAPQVEVVGLSREEFCNIFMFKPTIISEYTYISFLKTLDLFADWPGLVLLQRLKKPDYSKCFVAYFKRGRVIATDYKSSQYIYVVKTGKCTVSKTIQYNEKEDSEELREDINRLPLKTAQIKKIRSGSMELTIEVRSLHPGDSFGLEAIVYRSELEELGVIEVNNSGSGESEEEEQACLVSEGSECVLIHKKFFLKHFNERCKHRMQNRVNLFYEKEEMFKKLAEQETWRLQRNRIVRKTLKDLKERRKFKTVY